MNILTTFLTLVMHFYTLREFCWIQFHLREFLVVFYVNYIVKKGVVVVRNNVTFQKR